MISYIKGELTEVFDNSIVVENSSGIGMNIIVPGSVLERMPVIGSEVKIYTYLHVKEDALTLYGFLNRDDLSVFRLLITVNGIGPKGAIGILSTITPDDLRFAVLSDDVKAICAAPGIGAKTAQKLIIELKDKLKLEDAFEMKMAHNESETVSGTDARSDTIQALMALGYGRSEAVKAVSMIDGSDSKDSEALLKEALRKLALI
ncbi:MAG: Holliday junction branch migration protein RuvA [Bacteroides sp.]